MDQLSLMARAIELSKNGLGRTFPNPIVGAVLISPAGDVIGEGFHAGGDHAEVGAIKDCSLRGNSTRGATLYVTLEPCNHTGKRPPCTEAIIEAGIADVVYAVDDPNPIAQGGSKFLASRGVKASGGILEAEAMHTNRAWLHKISRGRPYFVWKIASTFDGFSAAIDGSSKWITSEESRVSVQRLRSESDSILIGTGTALADNPSLVPRGDARRPLRIVMGERSLLPNSKVLDKEAETLLIRTRDIGSLMENLGAMGLNSVLVESGPTLGTALLKAGCIDEIIWYQAPTILGSGRKVIGELDINSLSERLDFEISNSQMVGPDICTTLLPKQITRVGE